MQNVKRLIEVDLPIRRISDHSRREKSIRHGHISTLHLWWARRPLAACRAVVCATLWPDPADPNCPEAFRTAAYDQISEWSELVTQTKSLMQTVDPVSFSRLNRIKQDKTFSQNPKEIRRALLDFIADFSNWDNSNRSEYIEFSNHLTKIAHVSLGGLKNTKPLVLDPFAGGGSIPLEALRVGADAYASDLNPIPVLLNKMVLEYIPKYKDRLSDQVRRWGDWIRKAAEEELRAFYPVDEDGSTPITYLWARTIKCEGPGCGAELPLLRSLWLAKKGKRSVALAMKPNREMRRVDFEILPNAKASEVTDGTSAGGAATCPVCNFTTPVESVRAQLQSRNGGARDARLIAVVTNKPGVKGQHFRLPSQFDIKATKAAAAELERQTSKSPPGLSLIPDGHINHLRGFFNIVLYGITTWGNLFSARQALTLATFSRLVRDLPLKQENLEPGLEEAVKTCLALSVDRVAVRCTANCIWDATTGCIMQVFNQGQSLPARWEFAEMSPCIDAGSGWSTCIEYALKVLEHCSSINGMGHVERASATKHPLPDDSVQAVITDPPYYAAIPYADLSDFFYSWLKRSLVGHHEQLFKAQLTEKTQELVSLAHRAAMYREKDNAWFELQMEQACKEARRICVPTGLGVFVFANKETEAWEAMLAGLINAGWVVTASWPIETESGNRLRAKESAALASSVHLICRPRESADGALIRTEIGEWRELLEELPRRIHDWMPRLADEEVVGADAIFACLGPALEIFSRYSKVEKANGEAVTLREYLEQVWATVSREALSMIFKDADTASLEPDARLTAMFLWTLAAGAPTEERTDESVQVESDESTGEQGSAKRSSIGFVLDFDAARKIAQGLGAHLEQLSSVVEIKGDKVRLLNVAERSKSLFGSSNQESARNRQRTSKKKDQLALFELPSTGETDTSELSLATEGISTLDRVHQAMILFGSGRSEALKRFLTTDAQAEGDRFWKLAQALSALYPKNSGEKRWVDGVLARKRGLGL